MTPRGFRWIFRNPFKGRRLEREVDEEIAFHLEEKVRELEIGGWPSGEARAEARRQFGSVPRWRAATLDESRRRDRTERRRGGLETMRQDLATAFRQLVRRPGFALLTVAVLAAGIGTSTAVWAVLDAVLFRPLPFAEPERVVSIMGTTDRFETLGVSPANYLDWKAGQSAIEAMAATRATTVTLHADRPERIGALRVESEFFDVVGIDPRLGRRFLPEDDRPDAEPVAILSHGLWVRAFAADPDVLGRPVRVGNGRVTVVGVMPPDFRYLDVPVWGGPERELFLSDPFQGDRTSRWSGGYFWPVGRIAEGITLEQADARLDAVAARLAEAYPGINGAAAGSGVLSVRLDPLKESSSQNVRGDLFLVGGAALLLLLVVGVSAAGLLLARVMDRRRELAVRSSLGAGRGRLVRHVMLEIGLLCAVGAACGIAVAGGAVRTVRRLAPAEVAWLDSAGLDHRVLVGALLVASFLWLVAGLPPALRGTRLDLLAWLKEGTPTIAGGRRWGRRAVIVAQMALACALVSAAGITLSAYARLTDVDPGVETENATVLQVQLPRSRYAPKMGTVGELTEYEAENDAWQEQMDPTPMFEVGAEAQDLVRRVSERLGGLPGVREVAFANYPPLSGPGVWGTALPEPEGAPPGEERRTAYQKWVSPNYFDALGIRVLRGRGFSDQDGPAAAPVLVVNETFAERYLDGEDAALGTTLPISEDPRVSPVERTVVGVVNDVVHSGPHDPDRPAMYIPLAQRMTLWNRHQVGFALRATFLIRTESEPEASFTGFREALWSVDPELAVRELRTLDDLHRSLTAEPRFYLWLLGSFAGVALLLAATGTLGLLSQRVHQRTHELGVRRALGASAGAVVRLILKEGIGLSAVGVTLGLAGSWALTRVLMSRVPGVQGWAPPVQGVVVLLLFLTALAAAWIPARRAGRVDPMEAVRSE